MQSKSFIKMFNNFSQVSTVGNTKTPKVAPLGISYHCCDTTMCPCVHPCMRGIVSTSRILVKSVPLPNVLHNALIERRDMVPIVQSAFRNGPFHNF